MKKSLYHLAAVIFLLAVFLPKVHFSQEQSIEEGTAFKLFNPDILVSELTDYQSIENFKDNNNCSDEDIKLLKCEYTYLTKRVLSTYKGKFVLKDKYIALQDSLMDVFANLMQEYKSTGTFEHRHLEERNQTQKRVPQKETMKGGDNEIVFKPRSNTCFNADFEEGNVTGWTGSYATTEGEANLQAGWDMGPQNGTTGNHAIMGPGAGTDGPSGNAFPRVYPGGDYSLRLGNQDVDWQAAQVVYEFDVTADTDLFLYHFAAVMEDAGHTEAEQPYLRINLVIDGQNIECGEFYQAAAQGAEGFVAGPGAVQYKPWTTVSIVLSPYIGQTAEITFTTADCAQSGHFGYAYIDAECSPMPTLATDTLTCENPEIELHAPEGAETYQWTGPGIVGPDNTPSITVNAEGIYTVDVIPVQGPQCSYTLETEVIDNSSGEVEAEFEADVLTICPGETVSFTDLSTSEEPGGIVLWNWDFGDGVGTSSEINPSYQFNDPGTYTVTLQIEPDDGCGDSYNLDIVVSPLPEPDFTFTEICEGNAMEFTNTSTIEAPFTIDEYEWDILNNGISNYFTENPSHTFNDAGVFEVALTVTSNLGCEATIIQEVVVFDDPEADFSFISACEGEDIEFIDESTVQFGDINQWDWDFDDGNQSSVQNPNHSFQEYGTYDVTLTVTSNQGCSNSITQEIDMYPPPEADFEIVNACYYENLQFNDLSDNAAVWQWDFGDGTGVSNQQNPFYSYDEPGTYTVTLTIYSSNGCVNTHQLEAIAYPRPEPDFTASAVCLGFENEYTPNVQVEAPYEVDTYLWNFGGGNQSNLENPTHEFNSEGIFDVTLTVTTDVGCENSIVQEVIVYPLPMVGFTATAVCLGNVTNLTNTSGISNQYTENSIDNWEWHLGDGVVMQNTEDVQYIYNEDGTFEVTLIATSNHGCIDSTSSTITVHPLPQVGFASFDTTGCTPVCATFVDTSSINSGGFSEYIWDFGDDDVITTTTPELNKCFENDTYKQVHIYDVSLTVVSDMGCVGDTSKYSHVQVYPIPSADFIHSPNPAFTYGPYITFTNISIGATGHSWDFAGLGTSEEQHPNFNFDYNEGGVYPVELAVVNNFGCRDTVLKNIIIKDELIVHVPNAFTPDGDGINDLFGPVIQGHSVRDFRFLIFNRWGELIFESHTVDQWWDGTHKGKRVQQDVYVWKLIVRHGQTSEKHEYIGHVTLLK